MKPVKTKELEKLLKRLGCVKVGTVGSHSKWTAPGGHSTSVVDHTTQAPGTLRNIEKHLAPEFGENWLKKGLGQ